MIKYFKSSIIFTIACILLAGFWAHYMGASILSTLFIVVTLGVLEVSLSFDNAGVNAMKLEKLTPVWQHRFLTWGIIIAVFGMRFLFPLVVVSIFSHLNLLSVLNMALNNPDEYTKYLTLSHPQVVTFGAGFLIMLFFTYFFNKNKTVHWLSFLEKPMQKLHKIPFLSVILTIILLFIQGKFISQDYQFEVFIAGISGIIVFLLIEGISSFLENKSENLNISHSCLVISNDVSSLLFCIK